MGIDMAIAAMSVDFNQAKLERDMGVSVLKMAMGASTDAMEAVLSSLEDVSSTAASVQPALGDNVDIAV